MLSVFRLFRKRAGRNLILTHNFPYVHFVSSSLATGRRSFVQIEGAISEFQLKILKKKGKSLTECCNTIDVMLKTSMHCVAEISIEASMLTS